MLNNICLPKNSIQIGGQQQKVGGQRWKLSHVQHIEGRYINTAFYSSKLPNQIQGEISLQYKNKFYLFYYTAKHFSGKGK